MSSATINIDWCKDFSPRLAAFNRAFILTKGKGVFHYLELTGIKDDIEYCAKKEAELFYENKLIASPNLVYSNKDAPAGAHVYFLNTYKEEFASWYESQSALGSVFIFQTCSLPKKNTFSTSGCKKVSLLDDILKQLPLTCSKESLEAMLSMRDISEYDVDFIVNNTLMTHYLLCDDNALHPEDLQWLPIKESGVKAAEHTNKDASLDAPAGESDDVKVDKVEDVKVDTQKTQEARNLSEEVSVPGVDKKKQNYVEPVVLPPANPNIPVPTVREEEKPKGIIKNSLTPEENQRNYEMLSALKAEYERVYKYIYDLHNTKWKVIMNRLRESVDKNDLSRQFCPDYLEISDDISDPLYYELYQLDSKTEEFQNSLIRMVEPLGCVGCCKEWNEDVTFLPPGLHYVECPHCHATRAYEKPQI